MIDAKGIYLTILKSITNTADLRIASEGMGPTLAHIIKSLLDEMARNAAACVIAELPENA